ncbi:lytic transglycosylase domain-containing protein [Paenibacillus polymyxa]|uniref:Lytic transglycosylase domain-containing protein n=1 Tax=Paenibacillus ottowii TaxID=2315729 RepID=A0ABY3B412_9BACL|nr:MULTISPECIES: lytic transglycosylase domain-containing protein [Paenibacillus]KZE66638.1 lytic transglycosylase [Paenibacillus jamilae]NEU25081.1 lytic transglycosylase domain-containing protein [Paenibacillus polymyxa]OBA06165.1 lytic transglycosylase [Paenibacillus polymyxa]QDY86317.1 lytic transglycosylase domain-containing protein [Paenibacillus polymyxa]TQR98611.1 lytic transglycosylase domain-containing protein [Paenibacillus ottowii]
MNILRKKRVLLTLFVGFVLILFLNSNWMSWFYPIQYKDEIRQYSQTYEVDPFLVASIIRVETNFKTSKQSHKGALGLMQIMPNTANWIMDSAQIQKVPLESVKHEPGTNIELGTWYLHSLSMKFQDNPVVIIAAYNAGPGKVQEWLDQGVWDGKEESIKQIPFGETRHYVQRVIYYYRQYTKIYGQF